MSPMKQSSMDTDQATTSPVAPVAPKLDIEALQNQLIEKLNTSLADKINNLKFASVKEVASLKAENKVLKESMTELIDIVQKFAGTPTQEPKKKPYNPFADKEPSKFDFSKVRQSLNK